MIPKKYPIEKHFPLTTSRFFKRKSRKLYMLTDNVPAILIKTIKSFFDFNAELVRWAEKPSILWNSFLDQGINFGYKSLFIVGVVSLFTGAVSAVQTFFNLTGEPLIPHFMIALVVRDTMFSLMPTLIALIYAGKVGSNISSELGTMRITEQIDALEIMGVRSVPFIVLPKMLASLMMFPALVVLATFLSILGGYLTVSLLDLFSETDYIKGIRYTFNTFVITIIVVKSIVFSLIIPSVSSFHGYYVSGGALEVGKASTNAVTNSCIAVLVSEYLITQLMAVH